MFDHLLRELKKFEQGVSVPINFPLDEAGYFDRRCPSAECQFVFKVLWEDWRDKVSADHVYCPLCRHDEPATEWHTDDQIEYIKSSARAYLQDAIGKAMQENTRRFNQQPKRGFIQLSLSYKPGARVSILPLEAADAMQQRLTCEVCACHYAVIGAAFFCPACGHNSVVATFDQTIETVRQVVHKLPSVLGLLASNFGEDIAHNSTRNTLEESMTRLVGAFQQFAEALFLKLPSASTVKLKKNVFQRLADSSELWRSETGRGYDDLLTPAELAELNGLFQKRHLVAHRNGIVDQEYIDKSGDSTYAIGQRLVIKEATVLRLANLLAKLGGELRALV